MAVTVEVVRALAIQQQQQQQEEEQVGVATVAFVLLSSNCVTKRFI
jgi:hypothetical protein